MSRQKEKGSPADPLKGVNPYNMQLSEQDVEAGKHRAMVGGMWEEIGKLQFDFLVEAGLRPDHSLLDMGCGSMRGGVRFVDYLDSGNYYGVDINQSLLDAGRIELRDAGLEHKKANLIRSDEFDATQFGVAFDYVISVSLFTHLPINHILHCLTQTKRVMNAGTRYYATFFIVEEGELYQTCYRQSGGPQTTHFSDPFHYSETLVEWMAEYAGLDADYLGDWNHPRTQKMFCFRSAGNF